MYKALDTDNNREVVATGETRMEALTAALRLMDLPEEHNSVEDWAKELEEHDAVTEAGIVIVEA